MVELELTRMGPEDDKIETQKKIVYETEVSGVRTLDLYSGWVVEGEKHKFKLQKIPIKVCSFINIERLWVSHNNISELPVQIDQLVNLKELFLHYNSFKDIPSCIFRLKKLEILWMSSNEIKEVKPEISELKLLRQLHLEHNCLELFQDALCELPYLEVLYLNHNQLTSVSPSISQLADTLRRLYLNANLLSTIPETICTLKRLEILYLQENRITFVPSKFESFCATLVETNKAIIQVNNNPYVLPKPKVKLSVGGPPAMLQIHHPNPNSMRRHSDDYRQRSQTQPSGHYSLEHHRYSVPSVGVEGGGSDRERGPGRKSATLYR